MLDTGSVAPIFRLDAGLHHNFKQGVPVHFEIWSSARQEGQTLQIRVIQRSVVSFQLLLLPAAAQLSSAGWTRGCVQILCYLMLGHLCSGP